MMLSTIEGEICLKQGSGRLLNGKPFLTYCAGLMNHRSNEFNFYQLWLGIECHSRPDHYQLLGIKRFEADEQKIREAFDLRRNQLRYVSPGEHEPQWRKLADEIIAAKRCLLTPASRLAYDEHLRFVHRHDQPKTIVDEELTFADELPPASALPPANFTSEAPGNFQSPTIELPHIDSDDEIILGETLDLPPMAGDSGVVMQSAMPKSFQDLGNLTSAASTFRPISPSAGAAVEVSSTLPKLRRNQSRAWRMLIGSAIAAPIILFGFILLSHLFESQPDQKTKQLAKKTSSAANDSAKSAKSQAKPKDIVDSESTSATTTEAALVGPVNLPSDPDSNKLPLVEPKPVEPSATESESENSANDQPLANLPLTEEFRGALKSVRKAMAMRNLPKATELLASAEQLAYEDHEMQQIELHRKLLQHTGDFWDAVRNGAVQLKDGDELLEPNGKPFAVIVESKADKLILRVRGRNHIYRIPGNIAPEVAIAIVRRTIRESAEEDILLGAFYASDAAGDLTKAQELWQSAGEQLQLLLTVLKLEQQR